MLTLGTLIKSTEAAKRERQRAVGRGGGEDSGWGSKRSPQALPPHHPHSLGFVVYLWPGLVFRNNHIGREREREALERVAKVHTVELWGARAHLLKGVIRRGKPIEWHLKKSVIRCVRTLPVIHLRESLFKVDRAVVEARAERTIGRLCPVY